MFIFRTVQERLKTLIFTHNKHKFNKTSTSTNNNESPEHHDFFNIPYVPTISERFKPAIHDLQIKLSYTGMNKLHKFIHAHKDTLPKEDLRSNVVLQIFCKDCDASYVGQTRRLKTRIAEHRNHINRRTTRHSVITDHRLNNHEFVWDNVEILDEENTYGKRLMSEMIFIKRQTNSLNLQSDTKSLHTSSVYHNRGKFFKNLKLIWYTSQTCILSRFCLFIVTSIFITCLIFDNCVSSVDSQCCFLMIEMSCLRFILTFSFFIIFIFFYHSDVSH